MGEVTKLFNANDSVTGRDGGPYLDDVQAQQSEVMRARVEDREPDLDNPPANAGIQLNNPGQQAQTENVNNLPSQDGRTGNGYSAVASMDAAVESEDTLLKAKSEIDYEELNQDVKPVETKTDDFVADGSTDVGADGETGETPVVDDETHDETHDDNTGNDTVIV